MGGTQRFDELRLRIHAIKFDFAPIRTFFSLLFTFGSKTLSAIIYRHYPSRHFRHKCISSLDTVMKKHLLRFIDVQMKALYEILVGKKYSASWIIKDLCIIKWIVKTHITLLLTRLHDTSANLFFKRIRQLCHIIWLVLLSRAKPCAIKLI